MLWPREMATDSESSRLKFEITFKSNAGMSTERAPMSYSASFTSVVALLRAAQVAGRGQITSCAYRDVRLVSRVALSGAKTEKGSSCAAATGERPSQLPVVVMSTTRALTRLVEPVAVHAVEGN